MILVFADKKYPNTKGALWEKNKHKIQNTRIIKRAKRKYKGGKKTPVIQEGAQLTFLPVILVEANFSRNLLMITTNNMKLEPVY